MVTGPGFSSPNQPDQERTTAYRDSSGSNSRSDARFATIVGEWEEPSGESRFSDGSPGDDADVEVDDEDRCVSCDDDLMRRFSDGAPGCPFEDYREQAEI